MPLHEKRQFRLVRWMTTKSEPLLFLNLQHKVSMLITDHLYALLSVIQKGLKGTGYFSPVAITCSGVINAADAENPPWAASLFCLSWGSSSRPLQSSPVENRVADPPNSGN